MKKILLIVILSLCSVAIYANYNAAQEHFDGYNQDTEGRFALKNENAREDRKYNDVKYLGTKITSGDDYSCQLFRTGDVRCWGLNSDGELGSGSDKSSIAPQKVKVDVKFKQLQSGADFNCALDDGDEVYCWGSNERGQLGADIKEDSSNVPVKIATDVKFQQIYTEAHYACALDENNYAYCWGDGSFGEVGNGKKGYFDSPQKVKTDVKFSRLSMSKTFVCGVALEDDSNIYCWGAGLKGHNNTEGLDTAVPIKI